MHCALTMSMTSGAIHILRHGDANVTGRFREPALYLIWH